MLAVSGARHQAFSLIGLSPSDPEGLVQAVIYFAKSAGVGFGYEFGWHQGRVFSPELSVDWDDWREFPDPPSQEERLALAKVAGWLEPLTLWLRGQEYPTLMVVHYLATNGVSPEEATAEATYGKAAQQALKTLTKTGLLDVSCSQAHVITTKPAEAMADAELCRGVIDQMALALNRLGFQLSYHISQFRPEVFCHESTGESTGGMPARTAARKPGRAASAA